MSSPSPSGSNSRRPRRNTRSSSRSSVSSQRKHVSKLSASPKKRVTNETFLRPHRPSTAPLRRTMQSVLLHQQQPRRRPNGPRSKSARRRPGSANSSQSGRNTQASKYNRVSTRKKASSAGKWRHDDQQQAVDPVVQAVRSFRPMSAASAPASTPSFARNKHVNVPKFSVRGVDVAFAFDQDVTSGTRATRRVLAKRKKLARTTKYPSFESSTALDIGHAGRGTPATASVQSTLFKPDPWDQARNSICKRVQGGSFRKEHTTTSMLRREREAVDTLSDILMGSERVVLKDSWVVTKENAGTRATEKASAKRNAVTARNHLMEMKLESKMKQVTDVVEATPGPGHYNVIESDRRLRHRGMTSLKLVVPAAPNPRTTMPPPSGMSRHQAWLTTHHASVAAHRNSKGIRWSRDVFLPSNSSESTPQDIVHRNKRMAVVPRETKIAQWMARQNSRRQKVAANIEAQEADAAERRAWTLYRSTPQYQKDLAMYRLQVQRRAQFCKIWLTLCALTSRTRLVADKIKHDRWLTQSTSAARTILHFIRKWRARKRRAHFKRSKNQLSKFIHRRMESVAQMKETHRLQQAASLMATFLADIRAIRAQNFVNVALRVRAMAVRLQRAWRNFAITLRWRRWVGLLQYEDVRWRMDKAEMKRLRNALSRARFRAEHALGDKHLIARRRAAAFAAAANQNRIAASGGSRGTSAVPGVVSPFKILDAAGDVEEDRYWKMWESLQGNGEESAEVPRVLIKRRSRLASTVGHVSLEEAKISDGVFQLGDLTLEAAAAAAEAAAASTTIPAASSALIEVADLRRELSLFVSPAQMDRSRAFRDDLMRKAVRQRMRKHRSDLELWYRDQEVDSVRTQVLGPDGARRHRPPQIRTSQHAPFLPLFFDVKFLRSIVKQVRQFNAVYVKSQREKVIKSIANDLDIDVDSLVQLRDERASTDSNKNVKHRRITSMMAEQYASITAAAAQQEAEMQAHAEEVLQTVQQQRRKRRQSMIESNSTLSSGGGGDFSKFSGSNEMDEKDEMSDTNAEHVPAVSLKARDGVSAAAGQLASTQVEDALEEDLDGALMDRLLNDFIA